MASFHQVPNMAQLPTFIEVWFTADLVVAVCACAMGDERERSILGIPSSLFYLYGTSLIIAASVVAAYFADHDFTARLSELGGPR
jgi:hypothetical protein